eukprot:TCONS_00056913-protein
MRGKLTSTSTRRLDQEIERHRHITPTTSCYPSELKARLNNAVLDFTLNNELNHIKKQMKHFEVAFERQQIRAFQQRRSSLPAACLPQGKRASVSGPDSVNRPRSNSRYTLPELQSSRRSSSVLSQPAATITQQRRRISSITPSRPSAEPTPRVNRSLSLDVTQTIRPSSGEKNTKITNVIPTTDRLNSKHSNTRISPRLVSATMDKRKLSVDRLTAVA